MPADNCGAWIISSKSPYLVLEDIERRFDCVLHLLQRAWILHVDHNDELWVERVAGDRHVYASVIDAVRVQVPDALVPSDWTFRFMFLLRVLPFRTEASSQAKFASPVR